MATGPLTDLRSHLQQARLHRSEVASDLPPADERTSAVRDVMPALAREAAERMGAVLLTRKGGPTATAAVADLGRDEESPV